MHRLAQLIFMTLLLASMTPAATVFGQVYDGETLQPLSKAVVQINTFPQQTQVTDQNGYSFAIPNSGFFTISAVFVDDNQEVLRVENQVAIIEDGHYQVDLILFSDIGVSEGLQDILDESETDTDVSTINDLGPDAMEPFQGMLPWIVILILLIAMGVGWWHFSQKPLSSTPLSPSKAISIPQEKKTQALLFIKRRGGRVLQKDLRHELDLGEVYASLLIAELESEGRLKKIKHGRGNILVLKE